VHPEYLDGPGLVALWREALLAQKVLRGQTRGYRNHPQLERFRKHRRPLKAIANYLLGVWEESKRRGFHFNKSKVGRRNNATRLTVTRGQLKFEFGLLSQKLRRRHPEKCRQLQSQKRILAHPLFKVVTGPVEQWERTGADIR
jgi:hypothetical protein